jgi:DNA invertase Pin-like site-specific DNA recombinase
MSETVIGYARCLPTNKTSPPSAKGARRTRVFFNILATFAEFEVDLLRMRTREGMTVAKAKGRLGGKQPKLSTK